MSLISKNHKKLLKSTLAQLLVFPKNEKKKQGIFKRSWYRKPIFNFKIYLNSNKKMKYLIITIKLLKKGFIIKKLKIMIYELFNYF